MVMEEAVKISVLTADAEKDISRVLNLLNSVFHQNFAFTGIATGKDGMNKLTFELRGAANQAGRLGKNMDKVIKRASRYKTISNFQGNVRNTGKPLPEPVNVSLPQTYGGAPAYVNPNAMQTGRGQPQPFNRYNLPSGDFGGSTPSYNRYNLPDVGADFGKSNKPVIKRFIPGRDSSYDPLSPKSSLGEQEIKSKQKQLSLSEHFNKIMKISTTRVFMFQMAMLGVAFSLQGLMAQFSGIFSGGLSGLADTEGAIKNMVLSDAFAGTDILDKINMDEFVDSSLKAQGTLGGLNSVLTQMFNKVFSDPETIDKVGTAIQQLITALTSQKFIDAVLGIVDAITDPEFVKSMTDAAQQIAELVKWLGDNGLLGKIILLMIACQFLMPLFAIIQIALMALGLVAFAEIIAVVIIVIGVLMFLAGAFRDFGKSGDIVTDVINVVLNAFIQLAEVLTFIPRVIFDFVLKGISELTGGLINLANPFKSSVDSLYQLKDMVNAGKGSEGQVYDTTTHQYTTINFNKPVNSTDADAIATAIKAKSNVALG